MAEKTKLWDSVFKTDPSATKGFKRTGGFSGTAIKPLYLIHKATELWGSMGDAWGAVTGEHIINGNMVFIKARVWYPGEKEKAWVEHWGGDVLVKGEKQTPNDEAFKMAFTDAIGKCLVQLGFSADVHMGLFDDNKYVDERKVEEKTETAASAKRRFIRIQKAIEESEDPGMTWQEYFDEIKEFQNDNDIGMDLYNQLVEAGRKRRLQLQQIDDTKVRA